MNFSRSFNYKSAIIAFGFMLSIFACNKDDESEQILLPEDTFEGQVQRIHQFIEENELIAVELEEGVFQVLSDSNQQAANVPMSSIMSIHYTLKDIAGNTIEIYEVEPDKWLQIDKGAIFPPVLNSLAKNVDQQLAGRYLIAADKAFGKGTAVGIAEYANVDLSIQIRKLYDQAQLDSVENVHFSNYIALNNWDDPADTVFEFTAYDSLLVYSKQRRLGNGDQAVDSSIVLINYQITDLQGNVIQSQSVQLLFEERINLFPAFAFALEQMEFQEIKSFLIPSYLAYGHSVFVMPQFLYEKLIEENRIPAYSGDIGPFQPIVLEIEMLPL